MQYTADRKGCELVECTEGRVRTVDGVHCCWPGQGWSDERGVCVGEPQCAEGYIIELNECVPGPTLLDDDRDMVSNADDQCPEDPEDPDGFQDQDGCPELDNDDDDVFDADDACPMVPEDQDSYRDDDGCPDADNDGDGYLDEDDVCPNQPEELANRGKEGADGCPDDDDGDGLINSEDRCPQQAEDTDFFEDEDGCPEYDNDQDGFADGEDNCPGSPEDYDLFEDDDGCADADNDEDGVPDVADLCPDEVEDVLGDHKSDGCEKPFSETWAEVGFSDSELAYEILIGYRMVDAPGWGAIDAMPILYHFHLGWFHLGCDFWFGGPESPEMLSEPDDSLFGLGATAGVQLLSWPNVEKDGYSLLNPTIGAHVTGGAALTESFSSYGVSFRQAIIFLGLSLAVEYRGSEFGTFSDQIPSGPLTETSSWTFSLGGAMPEWM
jgi:hypothetical protein